MSKRTALVALLVLLVVGFAGALLYGAKRRTASQREFASVETTAPNSSSITQTTANGAVPSRSPMPKGEVASWQTCRNLKYDYEIRYPANWKIYKEGPYDTPPLDCENGITTGSLGFNPESAERPYTLLLEVRSLDDRKGSRHEGITSLEGYFSRFPHLREKFIEEGTIGGERAVWFPYSVFFFHRKVMYNFSMSAIDDSPIRDEIIASFRFTK